MLNYLTLFARMSILSVPCDSVSNENVDRLEEIVKYSYRFKRRTLIQYCLIIAAACLIFHLGQALAVEVGARADATVSPEHSLATYPTVELERGPLSIKGNCRDTNGNGIDNVKVALFYSHHLTKRKGLVRTANTDEQGNFIFSGLELPSNSDSGYVLYWIVAWHPGRASKMTNFQPDHPRRLELVMPKAERFAGRVTDVSGNPVEGAVIRFDHIHLDPIEGVLSSRTDSKGRFAVTDLSPIDQKDHIRDLGNGTRRVPCFRFHVQHPQFATGSIRYERIPGETDVILQPGATISGVVTYGDTGLPATGVPIHLQAVPDRDQNLDNDPTDWAESVTDENGHYRLTSLHAGKYNVWPSTPEYTAIALDSFEVKSGALRQAPGLKLIKGGVLAGKLADADTGEKVAIPNDAYVSVGVYGPSRPRSGAAIDGGRVKADGTFRFRLPPGNHYVYLSGTGPFAVVGKQSGARDIKVRTGKTTETVFQVRTSVSP